MPENKYDEKDAPVEQKQITVAEKHDSPQESEFMAAIQTLPTPDRRDGVAEDDSTPYDDQEMADAIGEIVAQESDELLAAHDTALKQESIAKKSNLFVRWWRKRWLRDLTILVLLAGIMAAGVVPVTRYWVLNAVGVRSSSSVLVLDDKTQLPLGGVHFSIGGHEALTDSKGRAHIQGLKLGPQEMRITQVGFATVQRRITVGWGTNPLGNVALTAVGVQYTIDVRDYLSDKPVVGVEAASNGVTALSDKDGIITLTLPTIEAAKDAVTLTKGGYRTEQIVLDANPAVSTKVGFVLARKTVFATKQSGKYDIYKVDIDGKNREVLLPGTGSENGNSSLVVSPDGKRAALVSTRGDKRDSDGFLLSTLTLINIDDGATLTIAESPQIQLIDWVGPRLAFQQVSSDSTAKNRYVVTSYNYADNTRLQLAAANELTAVLSAQGAIYYAVALNPDDAAVQAGLFKIGLDGNGKKTAFTGEVSTVLRTAYNTFSLQAADGAWHTYDIATGVSAQAATPTSLASRLYVDNADRSKSLWISQGTINSYDSATGKDTVIKSQSGIVYPVQWLSPNALLYRMSNGGETADYAMSTDGGTVHKIVDVAGTYGFAHAH